MNRPRLIEVIFEPEHWNQNCGCMIPAAWTAHVDSRDKYTGTVKISGDTREQAIQLAYAEYPRLTGAPEPAIP